MVKQVVLPQGVTLQHGDQSHQSKDAWHQFEGLVFVLISIHLAAFAFWCWLLYKSKAKRSEASGSKGGAKPAAAGSTPAASDWTRSPKEILKAYQKTQLGKA